MSFKVKDINIKNRTYYFFNDIIDIETFDPNILKLMKSYIQKYYYIGYVKTKEYVKN